MCFANHSTVLGFVCYDVFVEDKSNQDKYVQVSMDSAHFHRLLERGQATATVQLAIRLEEDRRRQEKEAAEEQLSQNLNVRVKTRLNSRIESLAKYYQVSKSDLLRQIIEAGVHDLEATNLDPDGNLIFLHDTAKEDEE